jgi:hypothetical protein
MKERYKINEKKARKRNIEMNKAKQSKTDNCEVTISGIKYCSTVGHMDDWGSRLRFPPRAGNFSLRHRVQNVSGSHPPSYPLGTRSSFPGGGRAAGAWSWPLTSSLCRGQRMRRAIPPLPQYAFMAWCLIKHRDNFTFTFVLSDILLREVVHRHKIRDVWGLQILFPTFIKLNKSLKPKGINEEIRSVYITGLVLYW